MLSYITRFPLGGYSYILYEFMVAPSGFHLAQGVAFMAHPFRFMGGG